MDLNAVLILCSRHVIRCAPATFATFHSNRFNQLTGHIYHLSRMLYNVVVVICERSTRQLRAAIATAVGIWQWLESLGKPASSLHLPHAATTAAAVTAAASTELDRSLGINILHNESKISWWHDFARFFSRDDLIFSWWPISRDFLCAMTWFSRDDMISREYQVITEIFQLLPGTIGCLRILHCRPRALSAAVYRCSSDVIL